MTQHIVFGSDHAGYKMKEELKAYIRSVYKSRNEQLFISDIGCNTDKAKSDYPDFAKSLSQIHDFLEVLSQDLLQWNKCTSIVRG